MLNTKKEVRTYKDEAYGGFAEVTKAMSSPRRLELLDVMIQGPATVEQLARALGASMASTSQHLQVLKRAEVVETRRLGTTIEYRVAPGVAEVFVAFRQLAEARSARLHRLHDTTYGDDPAISAEALRLALAEGEATLIDVRPEREYAHVHSVGALSVPLEQLEARMDELPRDSLIVAMCRGPYCVYATQAVQRLRASGYRAVRCEHGVTEWRLEGGAVESVDD